MEPVEYETLRRVEDRHWWHAGLHDLVVRRVGLEARRLGRPMDILDAGCGTGRLCERLQEFGSVTGCDLHPAAVEATRGRGVARVERLDLASDDLPPGKFDAACCIDVLYHRAVASERAVLRNLHRALRPGGLLIVQVPAFEWLRGRHDEAVHTRRRYRRAELVGLLRSADFAVEWASYRLPALVLPALFWRRVVHPPARGAGGAGATGSDLSGSSPRGLAALLARCVSFENRLLMDGWRFPFGTSVFAVARKIWSPSSGPAAAPHGL